MPAHSPKLTRAFFVTDFDRERRKPSREGKEQRKAMSEIPQKKPRPSASERLKREKNPWEAFDEVRAFAREGRSSVLPEWARLTSSGGESTRRATAWASPAARGRRPGHRLLHDAHRHPQRHRYRQPAAHHRRITRKYARNLADITVRQNIQLHWLTIESLPEVVDALDSIGSRRKALAATWCAT